MAKNQKQNAKKKILLLHTGGTIGMGLPSPALTPDESFAKSLHKAVPELSLLANVKVKGLCNKDSSQLTPQDWCLIAQTILKYEDDYDGFVVTHGTDTMSYSATAVSYLLPFPIKPVVFTGSQRPLGEIRSDARRNLICSVGFAAAQRVLETTIFFDTVLLRGNRSVKVHIEEFHTFDSPNFHWLAEERLRTKIWPTSREALNRPGLEPKFDGNIQVIHAFPGAQVELSPKAKCVVVRAFGCGNLPLDDSSILKLLKKARTKNIPVVLTSQVNAGSIAAEIYEMGRRALQLGAIPSGDMTFEATLIKCMMLAGNHVPYEAWPQALLANWAGEITVV